MAKKARHRQKLFLMKPAIKFFNPEPCHNCSCMFFSCNKPRRVRKRQDPLPQCVFQRGDREFS